MNSSSPPSCHRSAVHSNQERGPWRPSQCWNKLNLTDRRYLPQVLHYASLLVCFCGDKIALTCSQILRACSLPDPTPTPLTAVQCGFCNDNTIAILLRCPSVYNFSATYQQHSATSADLMGCVGDGRAPSLTSWRDLERFQSLLSSCSFQPTHAVLLKGVSTTSLEECGLRPFSTILICTEF